jgi:hypothetical protein
MDNLAELRVGEAERCSYYRDDALHPVVEQTLAQDTLSDHAGCAEEEDIHTG